MILSSFFAVNGIPTTGLTPSIKVWQVDGMGSVLVVNGDPMIEISDGFYQYRFQQHQTTNGYLVRVDGGVSLAAEYRYQTSEISPVIVADSDIAKIAGAVWDVQTTDHLNEGSFGRAIADIRSIVGQLSISLIDALELSDLAIKYQRNRTLIDKRLCTMTVFDDDQITPIRVFQLKDSTGVPSISDIVERDPIT